MHACLVLIHPHHAEEERKGSRRLVAQVLLNSYWSKESICLRYTDQSKAPDTEEKMKLVQMGLGFRDLKFEVEGDSRHIHSVIMQAYPTLEACGGYSLLRLGSGSSSLVIEPPRGGFAVRYIRGILKTAKLKDIESDEENEEDKE